MKNVMIQSDCYCVEKNQQSMMLLLLLLLTNTTNTNKSFFMALVRKERRGGGLSGSRVFVGFLLGFFQSVVRSFL